MLAQFEDMIINTLVQKLNDFGIKLDADTIKSAVANSPQVVQQIESILLSSSSEDKLEKIKALLSQAAQTTQGSGATTVTDATTTTDNK